MHLERAIRHRSRSARVLSLFLGVWVLLTLLKSLAPAEVVNEPAVGPASTSPAESVPLVDHPADLRRQQLMVSLYLLFGIIVIGCGMLLWIVWWGFRLRRRLLQPLPPAPRGDELWYLKRPVEVRPPTTAEHPEIEPPDDLSNPNRLPDQPRP